jgi:hypothetical protein
MLAARGQWTALALHVAVVAGGRSMQATPETAGCVGRTGDEDEGNEEGLEHEGRKYKIINIRYKWGVKGK